MSTPADSAMRDPLQPWPQLIGVLSVFRRCSPALPCQPASLSSGLHGAPEGSPLSTPWHLWLPADLSCVCEWVCGCGPLSPGVVCVSRLYMRLLVMATRGAGSSPCQSCRDHVVLPSSLEIMLPGTPKNGFFPATPARPGAGAGMLVVLGQHSFCVGRMHCLPVSVACLAVA